MIRKQNIVTISTLEAKYVNLSNLVAEITWVKQLLDDLKIQVEVLVIGIPR